MVKVNEDADRVRNVNHVTPFNGVNASGVARTSEDLNLHVLYMKMF